MPSYLEIPTNNNIQGGVDRSAGFATPFQLSATAITHCRYTFRVDRTTVRLMVESANPPTIEVDSASNDVLLGLVGIATQGTLEFDVQPGQWVQFTKDPGGSVTYIIGQETIFSNTAI